MNEGFDTDISKIFTDSKLFTQNITVNSKLIYFQIFFGSGESQKYVCNCCVILIQLMSNRRQIRGKPELLGRAR